MSMALQVTKHANNGCIIIQSLGEIQHLHQEDKNQTGSQQEMYHFKNIGLQEISEIGRIA